MCYILTQEKGILKHHKLSFVMNHSGRDDCFIYINLEPIISCQFAKMKNRSKSKTVQDYAHKWILISLVLMSRALDLGFVFV